LRSWRLRRDIVHLMMAKVFAFLSKKSAFLIDWPIHHPCFGFSHFMQDAAKSQHEE
jgi:hypothetical protein